MKIYTKTGDKGETSLIGGVRVPKDSLRIHAYGDVDELSSVLGVAGNQYHDKQTLHELQEKLFELSAEISKPDSEARITGEDVDWAEKKIDELAEGLPELKNFIFPEGPGAMFHFARCVSRRVERTVTSLAREEKVNPDAVKFLNRISDLLFMMARKVNKDVGIMDDKWVTR